VSASILVADADAARASRVADACEAHGMKTHRVATGPAALETALAELPDVIVTSAELPLIPAERLAEILRANPRTQGIPFLLVGGEVVLGRSSAFDERCPADTEPDEIAERVDSMLARQSRMDAVARGAGEDHAITGQLAQLSLLDLLQLLHLNRRTGTVEVARRGAAGEDREGRVFVREGAVIQAQVGAAEAEKALYRLLSWREGSFAFRPDRVQALARIELPTRALLLEGARQLDEWERVRASLPPREACVALRVKSADLPSAVQPLTQEVLLLLELYSRVGDVVDHCSHPDYQVLRTLETLVERGLVELRDAPGPPAVADGEGVFAPAQARRAREWLERGGPRLAGGADAKVVIVAADPEATREFLRRVAGLPGARVAPQAAQRLGPTDLASLGRLAVDDALGLELVHLPAAPEHAPLWPLVGRGALSNVVLLGTGTPEAIAALESPSRRLRELPRARVLHVLLAPGGVEPGVPARVRERLGLEGEDAVLELPPEGAEAGAALRALFHRMIP
jgi:CheY-like chemotaxis protein